MMGIKVKTIYFLITIALVSCKNTNSLQRYFVDKQEDSRFLKVDLATSMLKTEQTNLTQEQEDIFDIVKKINIVAYPLKDKNNKVEYQKEYTRIKEILYQENYEDLATLKSNNTIVNLRYSGKENTIDEVIAFASNTEKGFGVLRLLCHNMKPEQIPKLINMIRVGDLDVTQLSVIKNIFDEISF